MIDRHAVEVNQAHRDDLMRKAQDERIKHAAHDHTVRTPLYRPMVAWAGRRLMRLGFRLLVLSKEWDTRANTVYNGEHMLLNDVST